LRKPQFASGPIRRQSRSTWRSGHKDPAAVAPQYSKATVFSPQKWQMEKNKLGYRAEVSWCRTLEPTPVMSGETSPVWARFCAPGESRAGFLADQRPRFNDGRSMQASHCSVDVTFCSGRLLVVHAALSVATSARPPIHPPVRRWGADHGWLRYE